jgi:hypothetical protein
VIDSGEKTPWVGNRGSKFLRPFEKRSDEKLNLLYAAAPLFARSLCPFFNEPRHLFIKTATHAEAKRANSIAFALVGTNIIS